MNSLPSASVAPTVSVIIPTRDRPAFLGEAVASVLRQSRPPRRIIIVDDGSRTECRMQIGSIAGLHPSISLVELKESKGVGAARNAGLTGADGDFVLFLDDDDLLDPRHIELNGGFLADHPEHDAVVCRSRMLLTMPAEAPPPSWFWLPDQFNGPRLQANPLREILRFPIPINAVLFRRSCLGESPFRTDLRMGEERYLLLTLAAHGHSFGFQPLPLARVRIHPGNAQAAPDAARESARFYHAVLSGGLPLSGHDLFLCHARLLRLCLQQRSADFWPHLLWLFRSPHLFAFYGVWYLIVQVGKRFRYRALAGTGRAETTEGVPR